ncbi:leukocyte elastase inhibitor-like isoform X4 [Pimephales promelas]|uniref:leukocyte elastase inhibitor-like isoform X4 n=1 Tax=Pimephales promelas TaxID=90988 RepID=UPI001955A131|nr:leukocyte elastase inhibitor-like isoform X4 [Pimephales promelas]
MESLTAANTQFCLDLFKKISGGNASGNVFFSPVSISSALAMVSLGARGNTAAQMIKVLGFNNEPPMMQQTQSPPTPAKLKKCPEEKPEDQIHSSFNKFMSELNKPGVPYALSLANRLYGEQSYQFVEKFLNDAKSYYEAGLEKVDFIGKPEAARVNINKWVEKKTQEKIKDLVPQGSIDGMTKLVLVNAIYFKGNWEKKFPKEDTSDGQFKLNKTKTKPVKMMHQKEKFPLGFIEEINSQVLELPYDGKNLSMLIILPNEMEDDTTGLQKLEKALTYEKLMEWTKPEVMPQQEVKISLPRFKMEEKYDMKSLLISMGMEDVFDLQKVNLSGMSSNNDLVLSKVIHKAFVEVNEEGTEAAAATGAVMMFLSYIEPQVFNADHPFLFFIRHNPTKSILFYGRFCSP